MTGHPSSKHNTLMDTNTNTNDPSNEAPKDAELSDADLEQASGGRWEWDGSVGSDGTAEALDPWIAAG